MKASTPIVLIGAETPQGGPMISIGERSGKFGMPVIVVEQPEIWANVRDVARIAGAIITDETPERFIVLLQPAAEEQALTLAEIQALLPVVPDK